MDHKAVHVVSPDLAAKVPKRLTLPIASRFVRTDKGEKGFLKASSRLVVPGHLQMDLLNLPQKKEVGGLTHRQFLS